MRRTPIPINDNHFRMKSPLTKSKPVTNLPPPGTYRDLLDCPNEPFWHDHCDWLKERGYLLRPRCRPDWVPSWVEDPKKNMMLCEDWQPNTACKVMDATRIFDGLVVTLKPLDTADRSSRRNSYRLVVFRRTPGIRPFQPLRPQSRCAGCSRPYDKPRFDTFGEAIEFFRQIFQANNAFIFDRNLNDSFPGPPVYAQNRNNVAHRDGQSLNIMMDATPLYPKPYHPIRRERSRNFKHGVSTLTRTQRPVKYHLIDFGLSRKDSTGVHAGASIIVGGDKTVPEFRIIPGREILLECDPLPTDVYYMGNLIRFEFLEGSWFAEKKIGFEFMRSLVADMVQGDPTLRPSMDEVVERFEEIVRGLSGRKLRSRVANF
ncbi:hypothetical protein B0H11DRAFT_1907015 [Mycena galericulata]|nr:hypothetical protein B0H11DRAFT_1907015 [Mycena galericulata]